MKKYLNLFLIIVLSVPMLLLGISCYNTAEQAVAEKTTSTEKEVAETEVEPETGLEVIIESFAFDPSDLTIKAGDTVTWKQIDGVIHTVKIDAVESDNLSNGDTFNFTFDDAGTYEYICGIHPYMHGKIIVE